MKFVKLIKYDFPIFLIAFYWIGIVFKCVSKMISQSTSSPTGGVRCAATWFRLIERNVNRKKRSPNDFHSNAPSHLLFTFCFCTSTSDSIARLFDWRFPPLNNWMPSLARPATMSTKSSVNLFNALRLHQIECRKCQLWHIYRFTNQCILRG